MNKDILKIENLIRTDEEFQAKLKAAADAYTGEQTEEEVFNNVFLPVAAEYGIIATYDEVKDYLSNLDGDEMSKDELHQIAGGGKGGHGGGCCYTIGFGLGGASEDGSGAGCLVIGAGWGTVFCDGEGISD